MSVVVVAIDLIEAIKSELAFAEARQRMRPDDEYLRGMIDTYRRVLGYVDGTKKLPPKR